MPCMVCHRANHLPSRTAFLSWALLKSIPLEPIEPPTIMPDMFQSSSVAYTECECECECCGMAKT